MNYQFENVGCIRKVLLSIEKGKLNIKYGANGIGKSTLVKSIKYLLGEPNDIIRLENILSSYDFDDEMIFPYEIKKDFKHVRVYDSAYFNKLFGQTDLLNNTYELLFKNNNYETLLNNVTKDIEKIKTKIQQSNYFELKKVLDTCGDKEPLVLKNGSVVKSSSILHEYANSGVKITFNLPEELSNYRQNIESGYRTDWYKWISNAKKEWYLGSRCPFCGEELSSFSLSSRIETLLKFKSKNVYSEYDKEQSFVNSIANFVENDLFGDIKAINFLDGKATKENVKPLSEGLKFLKNENSKIETLMELNGKKLVNAKNSGNYSDFIDGIKKLILDKNLIIEGPNKCNIVEDINFLIINLINNLSTMKSDIAKMEIKIKQIISKNESTINDFLRISGLPYFVEIEQTDDVSFNTLFKHKNDNINCISNQLDYLSYGEANALAILLFCLEVKDIEDCLIVLDDPVSSFDKNKRYAIFDYIFNSNSCENRLLWGKTVIMFTHDYDSVLMFGKNYPFNRQDFINFSYLKRMNNELIEIPFSRDNFINSLLYYKRLASDKSLSMITRVASARHCCEIELGKTCDEYFLLCDLVHGREKPYADLSENDIFNSAKLIEISKKVEPYFNEQLDYYSFLSQVTDTKKMLNDYSNSNFKYEKLCLARCLLEKCMIKTTNITNKVAWNFLCEVYHVETDTIFSIDKKEMVEVPDYIISICDDLLKENGFDLTSTS